MKKVIILALMFASMCALSFHAHAETMSVSTYKENGKELKAQGKNAQALVYFKKALAAEHDWDVELFFETARCYEEMGQFQESATLLEEYLDARPDDVNIMHALASLYVYQLEAFDRALPLASRAVALNPAESKTHYLLGVIFWRQGKLGEAVLAVQRAIEKDVSDPMYYKTLAHVYEERFEYSAAIAMWREYSARAEDDIAILYHVADLEHRVSDYAGAIRTYNKILELKADEAKAYSALAELYKKTGDDVASSALYAQGLSLMPQDEGLLHEALRNAEESSGPATGQRYFTFLNKSNCVAACIFFLCAFGLSVCLVYVIRCVPAIVHMGNTIVNDPYSRLICAFLFLLLLWGTRFLCMYDDGSFVQNSESIYRGTIAREIMDGYERNLFEYAWWDREFGMVAFGAATVPGMFLFRDSLLSIGFLPACIASLTLIFLYAFMRRFVSFRAAIIAMTIFVFAPQGVAEFQIIPYSGYILQGLFAVVSLYMLGRIGIGMGKKVHLSSIALWGLLSGFTTYVFFTSLPLLVGLVIAGVCVTWRKWSRNELLVYSGCAFLGFLPWICLNVYTGFAGLRIPIHASHSNAIEYVSLTTIFSPASIVALFQKMGQVCTYYLPRFFTADVDVRQIFRFVPRGFLALPIIGASLYSVIRLMVYPFTKKVSMREVLILVPAMSYLVFFLMYPGELQLRWLYPVFPLFCILIAYMIERCFAFLLPDKYKQAVSGAICISVLFLSVVQFGGALTGDRAYAYNDVHECAAVTMRYTGKLHRLSSDFMLRDLYFAEEWMQQNETTYPFLHSIIDMQIRDTPLLVARYIEEMKKVPKDAQSNIALYLGLSIGENIKSTFSGSFEVDVLRDISAEDLHMIYEGIALSLANRRFAYFKAFFDSNEIESVVPSGYRHYFYMQLGRRIREKYKSDLDGAIQEVERYAQSNAYVLYGFTDSFLTLFLDSVKADDEKHGPFRNAYKSYFAEEETHTFDDYMAAHVDIAKVHDALSNNVVEVLYFNFLVFGYPIHAGADEFALSASRELGSEAIGFTRRSLHMLGWVHGLNARGKISDTLLSRCAIVEDEHKEVFMQGVHAAWQYRLGDDSSIMLMKEREN